MDDSRYANVESNPPLWLLERLDRAGDRFEDAWAAGTQPRLEVFLAEAPAAERPLLLRELLHLELCLRRRGGETPQPTDYLSRFPEHKTVIHEVFAETPAARPQCPEARPGGPPEPGRAAAVARPSDSGHRTIAEAGAGRKALAVGGEWPVVPGYEVLGELGKGGMGVVYRARHQGLDRVVALKMVRAGLDAGAEELARFRAEAALQARVQHPNIVQIFEIGEAGDGPYFALECVDGPSLDKRLAGTPQPPPAAAQLVETVARAVQHAHEKGLVHRDLKPANILVAADGTPKVGDFGLARQLEGDAGLTQSGAVVGTPSYLAPEQAWGRLKAIGPATDVYALGAILYELLTGRPPFLGATAVDTVLQVRHQEPVPPRRLLPKLPRDLETVCLKCLHKEPARRYATAAALAADLRRYQAGEPILARPVSAWERAAKWARRRPGVAALLVTLALVAGGSVAGLTALWLRARAAEATATAINGFLEDELLAAVRPGEQGRDVTMREVLDAAAPKIDNAFPGRPEVEAAVRRAFGMTYYKLGEYPKAEPHLRRALSLYHDRFGPEHPDTLNTVSHWVILLLAQGKQDEAEPLCRRNLETCRRVLGSEHPETVEATNTLAVALAAQGKDAEAERLHRDSLEIYRRLKGPESAEALKTEADLGAVLYAQGKLADAEPFLRHSLKGNQRIQGPDHPTTLETAIKLAAVLQMQGHLAEAASLYEQHLDSYRRVLGPEHSELLNAVNNFAALRQAQGKLAEAESLYRPNLEIQARVLGPEHPQTLTTTANLAMLLQAQGKFQEAETLMRQNLEVRRRTQGPEHPDTLKSVLALASALQTQGKLTQAEELYQQHLETIRRVFGPDHLQTLNAVNNLAMLLRHQGKLVEAEALLRPNLEGYRRTLGAEHPYTLVGIHSLVVVLGDQHKWAEAEALCRQNLEATRRALGAEHPQTVAVLYALGAVLAEQGKLAEAEPFLREALELRRKLLPAGHVDTSYTLFGLADVLLKSQHAAEAEPLARESLEIRRKHMAKGDWSIALAAGLLGECLTTLGRYAEAEPLLLEAYASFQESKLPPPPGGWLREIDRLIRLYAAWGKPDQAAAWRSRREGGMKPKPDPLPPSK